MRKRKLIRFDKLQELHYQTYSLGVPLARALENIGLNNISRPAAKSLLKCNDAISNDIINKSLCPTWLDPAGDNIQEQPDNYTYEGFFPLGKWVKIDADN